MVHPAADYLVFIASAEFETEGVIKFSCSGVPIVYNKSAFLEAKLAHNFDIETEEHLADSSSAHGIFNAEKSEAGETIDHRVGRAHCHIADSFAVAVNRNKSAACFECIGKAFIKKIGLFKIVVIKRAVIENALVILFFCGIGFYNFDFVCHILCFAMIAH